MSEPRDSRPMSEWLRVMLEEIARKQQERVLAGEERRRRAAPPQEPQEK